MTNIIEPCCIDRQLPNALHETRNGVALFQTNGDITAERIMKAVACMVKAPCHMWLMCDTVSPQLLQTIHYWQSRQWIECLHLLTQHDCQREVEAEFGAGNATIEYYHDQLATNGIIAFESCGKTVVIQGTMLLNIVAGLQFYTGVYGDSDKQEVKDLMDIVRSRCRVVSKKQGDKVQGTKDLSGDKEQSDEVQKTKPKRETTTRKKK